MADLSGNLNELRGIARAGEPDRYLAALLAPRRLQADLVTLAAFMAELGRVEAFVREPMMAAIRLQWWRDTIETGAHTGQPVADALPGLVRRHAVPMPLLDEALDATEAAVTARAGWDAPGLEAAAARREAAAFALAGAVLCVPAEPHADIFATSGAAYAAARALLRLAAGDPDGPRLATTARAALAEVRHLVTKDDRLIAALLPLALVEPYLRAYETARPEPREARAHGAPLRNINPLTRFWRLWRAHWRRRV